MATATENYCKDIANVAIECETRGAKLPRDPLDVIREVCPALESVRGPHKVRPAALSLSLDVQLPNDFMSMCV